MNLVAKEFVAARDDERGVLILSSFAGASCELPEALIVNPYDSHAMAKAFDRALRMSDEEQARPHAGDGGPDQRTQCLSLGGADAARRRLAAQTRKDRLAGMICLRAHRDEAHHPSPRTVPGERGRIEAHAAQFNSCRPISSGPAFLPGRRLRKAARRNRRSLSWLWRFSLPSRPAFLPPASWATTSWALGVAPDAIRSWISRIACSSADVVERHRIGQGGVDLFHAT